jgi:hypothetical protein
MIYSNDNDAIQYMQNATKEHYTYGNFTWAGDWEYVIRSHLALLRPKPRYVVFNAGLWGHDFDNNYTLPSIRRALDDHGMIGIYKTTHFVLGANVTATRTSTDGYYEYPLSPYEATACQLLHYCWDLSWTGRYVNDSSVYVDGKHFGTTVNSKLASELLDLLRNISKIRD